MRLIAQYLTFLFVRNFLMSSFGLSFLFTFQSVLEQMRTEGFPFSQSFHYHMLGLPEIFVRMAPPSVLISVVLSLSSLNRTNELVAFHSIGVGLRQIIGVLLSIVFVVSCFTLVLQDRVLPLLYRKQIVYYWHDMRGRSDFFLDVKRSKIWYRSNNMIYNLENYDAATQSITGMSVYTFNDQFELVEVKKASQASFQGEKWVLKDGTVTVFVGEDQFPLTKKFDQKELLIEEKPKDFIEIEKEVDGLRLKELWAYINKTRKSGVDTKNFEVKFHYRVSLSFLPLIMGLLAVPFSVTRRREGGVGKDLGICLLLTFMYWMIYNISLTMGKNGTLIPWIAAWLPSVVFLGLAAVLLTRKRT